MKPAGMAVASLAASPALLLAAIATACVTALGIVWSLSRAATSKGRTERTRARTDRVASRTDRVSAREERKEIEAEHEADRTRARHEARRDVLVAEATFKHEEKMAKLDLIAERREQRRARRQMIAPPDNLPEPRAPSGPPPNLTIAQQGESPMSEGPKPAAATGAPGGNIRIGAQSPRSGPSEMPDLKQKRREAFERQAEAAGRKVRRRVAA